MHLKLCKQYIAWQLLVLVPDSLPKGGAGVWCSWQSLHWNGFSPVWTLWCDWRLAYCVNLLGGGKHANSIESWTTFWDIDQPQSQRFCWTLELAVQQPIHRRVLRKKPMVI